MDSVDKTFINALFTPDYYRGYDAIEHYMAKVVLGVLDSAGVSGYLRQDFSPAADVMERFGFHPQSGAFVGWALAYLEKAGLAEADGPAYRLNDPPHDTDTTGDVATILRHAPTAEIFVRLVERIVPDIPDFLHGRKKGGDILFSGEALSLWNDYFNNRFLGYSVMNHGAAYGITKWFSDTRGKRMLEVGSGTSGATVKVFRMLRDNNLLDSMEDITLTDVVPPLLELGRRNIDAQMSPPPAYSHKVLDINRPFAEQGFSGPGFDIVFGVNVLHVARDIAFSLKEIRGSLAEGGILVIAETIRPEPAGPMHHEIVFNLLPNYYDVTTDPVTRPFHGFLTRRLWEGQFEAAGFRNIESVTELDRHARLDFDIRPLHSLLVLKGQK